MAAGFGLASSLFLKTRASRRGSLHKVRDRCPRGRSGVVSDPRRAASWLVGPDLGEDAITGMVHCVVMKCHARNSAAELSLLSVDDD